MIITNTVLKNFVNTDVTLTVSGGSGTGSLTANANPNSCMISGTLLKSSVATSCIVTVTKAASPGFLAVTSTPVTFTFTQPTIVNPTITLAIDGKNILISATTSQGSFYGLGNGSTTPLAKINGSPVKFGTYYQIARGTYTLTVTFNSQVIYNKQFSRQT